MFAASALPLNGTTVARQDHFLPCTPRYKPNFCVRCVSWCLAAREGVVEQWHRKIHRGLCTIISACKRNLSRRTIHPTVNKEHLGHVRKGLSALNLLANGQMCGFFFFVERRASIAASTNLPAIWRNPPAPIS